MSRWTKDLLPEKSSPFLSSILAPRRYRWAVALTFITIVFYLVLRHDFLLTESLRPPLNSELSTAVDWSQFAYTQYVTNSEYLCNSVMFFEALDRLSSRADRVMMYPSNMIKTENDTSRDADLLIKARDEYNVKLIPITVQHKDNADATWADSFTKLLAFNQTQYSRVLSIDSDSMILQNMDELFLLPPVPVAMPRAYWMLPDTDTLSSQVILIQPSETEFSRIMAKIDSASKNDYDMEIVNDLYGDSALVLPHRPYDMITGEFREDNHTKYLGSDAEPWDPVAAYNEAKLIHFSDWPIPKPWIPTPEDLRLQIQPACTTSINGTEDCTTRTIWNSFYTDFKLKRKDVCGQNW
ncbi:hypothetical protein FLONG3_9032 [Fusarium longipes]|uniref:Glucose n-acetyltransferase 1 n=1 Tax=Fusarium longipes TaxID=694270 RepID=A0A395S0F9_9HYPO|nr:hypothetical protein FLONG3_9032 [Fusarium longipes]